MKVNLNIEDIQTESQWSQISKFAYSKLRGFVIKQKALTVDILAVVKSPTSITDTDDDQ